MLRQLAEADLRLEERHQDVFQGVDCVATNFFAGGLGLFPAVAWASAIEEFVPAPSQPIADAFFRNVSGIDEQLEMVVALLARIPVDCRHRMRLFRRLQGDEQQSNQIRVSLHAGIFPRYSSGVEGARAARPKVADSASKRAELLQLAGPVVPRPKRKSGSGNLTGFPSTAGEQPGPIEENPFR